VLRFSEDVTFVLTAAPRMNRDAGNEVVTVYPVMVLGGGRPAQITVKVPGASPPLTQGDQVAFSDLQGNLYRGKQDPGNTSQRITFTASKVVRAEGRKIPEGVEV